MTPELLRAAVTGCTPERAELVAGPLSAACAFYGIDTPDRLAIFLAQVGHESGGFRYATELWGPTAAQRRYEGRADLGNTEPGDGERFKGHGYIQTTGRFNHARVRDRLRERFPHLGVPDFEAEPERLAEVQWACLSAADYWDDKGLNALADAGDFLLITRRINGGFNGLADRQARWERARRALAAAPVPAPHLEPDNAVAADPGPAAAIADITEPPQEAAMPIPAVAVALLPSLVQLIPALGQLFGSGSEVAERNVKAVQLVADTVVQATGSRNLQEAVETMQASPAAVAAAATALEQRWFELVEVGGGIEAARKADQAAMATEGPWWQVFKSPSFLMGCLLLPLVYLVVFSIIGLVGDVKWSNDVRASIAGLIVGTIVGGLMGYYFGQTTSRNRGGPAPAAQ
jgi:putative chitinase